MSIPKRDTAAEQLSEYAEEHEVSPIIYIFDLIIW